MNHPSLLVNIERDRITVDGHQSEGRQVRRGDSWGVWQRREGRAAHGVVESRARSVSSPPGLLFLSRRERQNLNAE